MTCTCDGPCSIGCRGFAPCPTCGNLPCECSASVGQDGVTAIDRSQVPWRVWRDVSPHATVEAGVFTWR